MGSREDTALDRLARGFPVLAITGPRQSGKTTLARASFPDKPYASLENLNEGEFAAHDPKRFLARFVADDQFDLSPKPGDLNPSAA